MDRARRVSLALSDDNAIESILLDIPFFCVGIMTFGVSTFLLIMKRVNILGLCLYVSALLAFSASIFNLSQLLTRGQSNVSAGEGIDTVRGLINSREVSLALSIGFRYLFYWIFVAQRPRREAPSDRRSANFNPRYDAHSSSWQRWGYLGFIMKWGLLGLILSVPVLQIVWRIAQRNFGIIYMVDNTIQIVIASLLILKLFLNVYLCNTVPRWRTFAFYIAPIVALLISLADGVGDLILFNLSDTTLGHFLQAVEIYILVVYLLVILHLPDVPAHRRLTSRQGRLPMQTQEYNEKAGPIDISGPIITSPRQMSQFSPTRPERSPEIVTELRSPTILLSSPRSRRDFDIERDAGLGQDPDFSDDNAVSGSRPEVGRLAVEGDMADSSGRSATVSFSSYYNMPERESEMPPPPSLARSGNDSPIYGLNGIIGRFDTPPPVEVDSSRLSVQPRSPARASETSFDELLRQQNELDRSIAALRLFSPRESTISFDEPPMTRPPLKKSISVAASTSSGVRADTSSARSEFSLSIFPEPPMQTTSFLRPQVAPDVPHTPPLVPQAEENANQGSFELPSSIPTSPVRPGLAHTRFDSAGTQYDVTSFIGDLTVVERPSSVFRGSGAELSDVESGDESPVIVTALTRASSTRSTNAVVVGSATPALTSLPSRTPRGDSPPPLRPFLLGNVTASPVVSSPLAGTPLSAPYISRNAPIVGPRRPIPGRSRGLSGTYRPRLQISGPKTSRFPDSIDSPDAYERPRPPPLIIPSNSFSPGPKMA